ncbi:MAG: hypothetical protein U9R27_11100 [Campylobacterota bacterium]|nr:hypothetical protein [Campylobacterota bacterium]
MKYAEDELFSITDFAKQLSSIVKNIKSNTIEKIGILKNNRLEAVIISTEEYARLKKIEFEQERIILDTALDDYRQNGSKNFSELDNEYWNDTEKRLISRHKR